MTNGVRTAVPALLVGLSVAASAALGQTQNSEVHQSTSPPPNARFEIVQSELAAKWTFRLDRFTGHVWQLVKTKTDDDAWEAMKVVDLPPIVNPTMPRFQIFESGIAAKFTFLIDTLSGQTWTLTALRNKSGSAGETVWAPFEQ